MKSNWRSKRRKIFPPTVLRLVVGDLLRRNRDGAICLVMEREYLGNYETIGRERYRYRIHGNGTMVYLDDVEIIACYEVLTNKADKTKT